MSKVIFAPHLDDEVLGCYSILDQVDCILYFSRDYREDAVRGDYRYLYFQDYNVRLGPDDTIYLPSKYDYHPLHRKVREIGIRDFAMCQKMYYSVEMNTPWLEEESDVSGKRALFEKLYPKEDMKNDKYFLFRSIKPFDDLIWAVVRFQWEGYHCWPAAPSSVGFLRDKHRHLFHFEVRLQQFGGDRDIEYILLSRSIRQWVNETSWSDTTSCEQFAMAVKHRLELLFPSRLVQVSVFEDGENGCVIE